MVTPSEATRQELAGLGLRPERVTAVDNGVDPFFSPGGTQEPDVPLVVAAGRMAPVKRFELVLEAAAEARRAVPDLQLRLIGEGPLRAELAGLGEGARRRGLGRPARSRRSRALRAEYRRAWVVASGSLAEGWGLTLTEAAACGTPAVATDIRGHRCSVVDGQTGVLAPPERLGAALHDDADRRALRASAGRAAQPAPGRSPGTRRRWASSGCSTAWC